MKYSLFKTWLEENYPNSGSVSTYLSDAKRVDSIYGDLDRYFDDGKIDELVVEFEYSSSDAKAGKPNPTKIPITGKSYSSLGSYRSAIRCYKRFREINGDSKIEQEAVIEAAAIGIQERKQGRTFELESHLQSHLRKEIEQLEPNLVIVDGGVERIVNSGKIDILAQDGSGRFVVIELKRETAQRDAIGQIVGYMGDIMDEEDVRDVRGILVAGGFDKSCKASLKVIPNLSLKKYRFNFMFEGLESD